MAKFLIACAFVYTSMHLVQIQLPDHSLVFSSTMPQTSCCLGVNLLLLLLIQCQTACTSHQRTLPDCSSHDMTLHAICLTGGATWPTAEGQDFIDDHASPDIDFATIHSWVDNWKVC
jgi:hypothetical protein